MRADTLLLRDRAEKLEQLSGDMALTGEKLKECRIGLQSCGDSFEALIRRLEKEQRSLDSQRDALGRMAGVLIRVAENYERTEDPCG